MKILFIAMTPLECNSSVTIQNKIIIKGLVSLGHSVSILTSKPDKNSVSYDDSENTFNGLERYYLEEDNMYAMLKNKTTLNQKNLKTIIIKNIRELVKALYNKLKIFDAQKSNVKNLKNVSFNAVDYDCIISASDPKSTHLLALEFKKLYPEFKGKWIQYWGDPMYDDITREKSIIDIFCKRAEKKLIASADKVVYATPFTLERQKELYPVYADKMDYIHQGYYRENHLESTYNNETIKLGYFGNYSSKLRNIMNLYKVVNENKKITLTIGGGSDINLSSTENIDVKGILSFKESGELESQSDILVCICNNKGTQIPGKIYYCASYNKPIIVILDGDNQEEMFEYLGKFNRYILCYNNYQSIEDAINQAEIMIENYKVQIHENLSPKYIAKKVIE